MLDGICGVYSVTLTLIYIIIWWLLRLRANKWFNQQLIRCVLSEYSVNLKYYIFECWIEFMSFLWMNFNFNFKLIHLSYTNIDCFCTAIHIENLEYELLNSCWFIRKSSKFFLKIGVVVFMVKYSISYQIISVEFGPWSAYLRIEEWLIKPHYISPFINFTVTLKNLE